MNSKLNYKALIDFNKYMLALSGAGFLYSIESKMPTSTLFEKWYTSLVLLSFTLAIVLGVLVFSAATSALHPKTKSHVKDKINNFIATSGTLEVVLVLLGLLGLGIYLAKQIWAPVIQ